MGLNQSCLVYLVSNSNCTIRSPYYTWNVTCDDGSVIMECKNLAKREIKNVRMPIPSEKHRYCIRISPQLYVELKFSPSNISVIGGWNFGSVTASSMGELNICTIPRGPGREKQVTVSTVIIEGSVMNKSASDLMTMELKEKPNDVLKYMNLEFRKQELSYEMSESSIVLYELKNIHETALFESRPISDSPTRNIFLPLSCPTYAQSPEKEVASQNLKFSSIFI